MAGRRGTATRRAWLKRLAKHPMRAEFERVMAGRLPEAWHEAWPRCAPMLAETRPTLASRASPRSRRWTPWCRRDAGAGRRLGRPRPAPPAPTRRAWRSVVPGNYAGRYIHFGVREHGMAAA